MANRLQNSSSPYLRQHGDNPVDWYPWGPEALERARLEDKPILLSIGYSACHWCHVMAHESFENPQTAALMNERFINIKVDREERPDLDQIYQNVAQLMTRSGGWPLTVFLTPDLRPFFGGTYFPPQDSYGRPGFPRLLLALSGAYKSDHTAVLENASKLTHALSQLEDLIHSQDQGRRRPDQESHDALLEKLLNHRDEKEGGFGHAPKFPNTMNISYLWRMWLLQGHEKARDAVVLSLRKMACGGIFDQLGGGFHRYSVDETWSVPHFEKMLYDNGLLLKLYSEVLLTGSAVLSQEDQKLFTHTVRETVAYVLRDMQSPSGAFYSSQDADSEGEEGKYFVWDQKDLGEVLTPEEAHLFAEAYGVSASGNFEGGKTVLSQAKPFAEIDGPVLAKAREKLLQARQKRVAPGRDDKILTSWNGLMISGLTWAAQALRQQSEVALAETAQRAAEKSFLFFTLAMTRPEGKLYAALGTPTTQVPQPRPVLNAYLDDYAFLSTAALDLARFSENVNIVESALTWAQKWVGTIVKHFRDDKGVGFFFTSDDHESLIQRPKSIFDQAIPSGIGVALQCLLVLAEMNPENEQVRPWRELAHDNLATLWSAVLDNPYGCGELSCAALLAVVGPVVVSGGGSQRLAQNPFVYRRGGDQPLLCHQQACQLLTTVSHSAEQDIIAKLRQTWA